MESAWRLGGVSIVELGKRVWAHINEILDRSAALSYYFIFALFPTLLFLTALLALLPIPHLLDRLMAYITAVLPGTRGCWSRKHWTKPFKAPMQGCCPWARSPRCGRPRVG